MIYPCSATKLPALMSCTPPLLLLSPLLSWLPLLFPGHAKNSPTSGILPLCICSFIVFMSLFKSHSIYMSSLISLYKIALFNQFLSPLPCFIFMAFNLPNTLFASFCLHHQDEGIDLDSSLCLWYLEHCLAYGRSTEKDLLNKWVISENIQ